MGTHMVRILAINGAYRDDGMTDQAVNSIVAAAMKAGAEVEVVLLRDYPIAFCKNCRQCTQEPGSAPGVCVHHDAMPDLLEKIEAADAYILASPVNFGSATALFKRFMERLVVYAYWPWGKPYPEFRKANATRKKAVLVSSSAAPGLLGRWFFSSLKQLRMTAKTIGADSIGSLFTGHSSQLYHPELPPATQHRARALGKRLAS